MNYIIPTNNIANWTILDFLAGTKLSGQVDTLTVPSIFLDEVYKKGEKQNEQQ